MNPTIYSASPLEHPRSTLNFTHTKLKSTFVHIPAPVILILISGSSSLSGTQARSLGLIPDIPIPLPPPTAALQSATSHHSQVPSALPPEHNANSLHLHCYPALLPPLLQQPQTLSLPAQIYSPHRGQSDIWKMSVILPHSVFFFFSIIDSPEDADNIQAGPIHPLPSFQ